MSALPRTLPLLIVVGGALLSGVAFAAESVSVPPFRSVELRGGGHLTLRPGQEQRVTILNGTARITRFHVKDRDKLVIDACDNNCPHHYDLEIEIVTPEINGVAISGGGEVVAERGFGHQRSLGLAIEGGGEIDVRAIPVSSADAAVDGGGDIRLRAERSLEAAVSGGGNISYWGNPSVTSAVDGGGSVNRGGG
jgi:hypothetical protein